MANLIVADSDDSMEFNEVEYVDPVDAVPPPFYKPLRELNFTNKLGDASFNPFIAKRKFSVLNSDAANNKENVAPVAPVVKKSCYENKMPGNFTDRPLLLADTLPLTKVHTKQLITGLLWKKTGALVPVVRIINTYPRTVITLTLAEWDKLVRFLPDMLEYFDDEELKPPEVDQKPLTKYFSPNAMITFTKSPMGYKAVLISHPATGASIYMLASTVRCLSWRKAWITRRLTHLSGVAGADYRKGIVTSTSKYLWLDVMGGNGTEKILSYNSVKKHILQDYDMFLDLTQRNMLLAGVDTDYLFDFFGQTVMFYLKEIINEIIAALKGYQKGITQPVNRKSVTFALLDDDDE